MYHTSDDAFYETKRYYKNDEDGNDAIAYYISYCGESRYYGNSMDDYNGLRTGYGEAKEKNLDLGGATGKRVTVTSTEPDSNYDYIDTYVVDANGSIFTFAFFTEEAFHDQGGMDSIVEATDFASYQSDVGEVTAEKGKFLVPSDSIMRQIISAMNKNNDTEDYGCGHFSYEEGSTKGGALSYTIYEDDNCSGVTISFYTDTKLDKSIKEYSDIPKTVAASFESVLDYEDELICLIYGSIIQVTGDVNFDQGYSNYVNTFEEATGYESLESYTNSLELNGLTYDMFIEPRI